jgi:hypothetical protein
MASPVTVSLSPDSVTIVASLPARTCLYAFRVKSGSLTTVHHPDVLASSAGRKDVINVPMVGTDHTMQMIIRTP